MKKLYLLILMWFIYFAGFAQSSTFNYSAGAVQTYTVPAGTYSIGVDLQGAAGGKITGGGTGGAGGRIQSTINVTPGTVLYVYIGQKGVNGNDNYGAAPAGGNNSGGGADGGSGSSYDGGGAGGGSTDIRTVSGNGVAALSSRLVVAGGGGGGAFTFCADDGGGGGGLIGGTGVECGSYYSSDEGTPGTQVSGGLAGFYSGYYGSYGGTPGAFGKGGNSYNNYDGWGGGGGGGWFGAGGAYIGGGCGGSSYSAPGITTAVTHTQGFASATANGKAILTPLCNFPGVIVGNSPICAGTTLSLSNPTGLSQGTWSSDNTGIASINSTTGLVTGVAAGTANITFNVPNNCTALSSVVVTINPVPVAITGTFNVCTGLVTTLSDATSGGSWSSTATSISTVDAFGNVTGVGIGSDSIVYTLPQGCATAQPVTVNGSPGPILGVASVCQGSTTSLTNSVGGGTWVSGSAGFAAINVFGIVTGLGTGTGVNNSNITYTLADGCHVSRMATINPLPFAFPVGGTNSYCAGGSSITNIILLGSATDVSYQLFNGPAAVGAAVPGSLGALNFGMQSTPGTYTVVGTNTTTGCVNNMNLSATVSIKPLPVQFFVGGGGSFCSGGGSLGVPVTLSGSAINVKYELLKDGSSLPLPVIVPGTGSPLNFGFQSLQGSYTVVATSNDGTPNCNVNMIGSASVVSNPLPDVYNVTGGGVYCTGDIGVPVGLDFSNAGISYQLYKSAVPAGMPVLGTGGSITFGLQTAISPDYTVIATNVTTTCTSTMAGTASVSLATPPAQYDVTGTNAGCAGTIFPIGLSGSDAAEVTYQLYKGSIPVGSAVPGVSGALDLATVNVSGTYTVKGTDQTTHCSSNMDGAAVITVQSLPTVYNLSAGGGYCVGNAGIPLTLNGSQTGVTYSLYYNLGFVASFSGTGDALSLGTYTNPGSYTVVAVNPSTTCTSNMAGAAVIVINPLPVTYNVTGGGTHCAGSDGVDIGLDMSAEGINYQLYLAGVPTGSLIPGTGSALDFGLFTATGTYTVVGSNPATTCAATMLSSASIAINPLPALHSVSGGGSYCSGDAGRSVSISGSDMGISYQLYNGVTPVGSPVSGTGAAIDFGIQTLAGTYTVGAIDSATSCAGKMSGGATIVVNASPALFTVTGGGSFCAGSPGMHIGLGGSNAGVNYLLYNAGALVSTIPGSGSLLDFGLETASGTYTIVGTNPLTGCHTNMDGNAVIIPKLPPTAYSVIGGGSYCVGSPVIPSIGLNNSGEGVNYQLYKSGSLVGAPLGGTGGAIDFGMQADAGMYTIVATDATTGCTKNMTGSAAVIINSLPPVNTVTGGGSYCIGGAGYHIYLSNSNAGIQYQLINGGVTVSTILGTGAGVDFGMQSVAGTYTVAAVNPGSGCTSNMAGSAVIVANSLPVAYDVTVSNGGNYCATGSGVHVGLDGSSNGISYQLFNGMAHVGAAIAGTGSDIDFGLLTSGNYTIVGTNTATGCAVNMTGGAMVNAIPLPNVYALTGGGNYCATGLGLHIGLSGSDAGTMYQLYHGTSATGAAIPGTGDTVDFGLYTGAGTYTAVAVNDGAMGCNNNMGGASVITVYPVVVPSVSIAAAGGDTACLGNVTHFTASSINGGLSPLYDWTVNGVASASGDIFSYLPSNGDMVTVRVHSNGVCAVPDTASRTILITVSLPQLPSVHVSVTPGDIVCEGAPVTFTGTTTFGGTNPVYTWIKNSAVVSTGLTYSYIPANSDIIMLRMVSNFACRLADTVFSVTNTMEVDPPVIPIVTVLADPGNQVGAGQSVTFTATVEHTGSIHVYQWLINGVAVSGATSAAFTSSTLNDNDSVTCEVTGGCDLKGFNSIRMHVSNVGVQQITAAGNDNIKLIPNPNKGVFTVRGTLAATGDEEASIEVTNMLGQIVYTKKITLQNGNINEQIQLSSSLANGMYILNLRSGLQDNVFHFVIEQ